MSPAALHSVPSALQGAMSRVIFSAVGAAPFNGMLVSKGMETNDDSVCKNNSKFSYESENNKNKIKKFGGNHF